MADINLNDLSVVTEVGVFGSLNINDPTAKKVNKKDNDKDVELEALIQESIEHNKNI